jgi:hypothetical protein
MATESKVKAKPLVIPGTLTSKLVEAIKNDVRNDSNINQNKAIGIMSVVRRFSEHELNGLVGATGGSVQGQVKTENGTYTLNANIVYTPKGDPIFDSYSVTGPGIERKERKLKIYE